MYKIQGADQRQYGPVSADTLRQWIAEGRIIGSTLIQPEGATDWRPASQFPEFEEALRAAPAPAGGAPPPPAPPTPRPRPAPVPAATAGPAQPGKTSGMAIASLILAILTLPTCGIGGIIGLILGIVSLVKISNSQGRLRAEALLSRVFASRPSLCSFRPDFFCRPLPKQSF